MIRGFHNFTAFTQLITRPCHFFFWKARHFPPIPTFSPSIIILVISSKIVTIVLYNFLCLCLWPFSGQFILHNTEWSSWNTATFRSQLETLNSSLFPKTWLINKLEACPLPTCPWLINQSSFSFLVYIVNEGRVCVLPITKFQILSIPLAHMVSIHFWWMNTWGNYAL